jgi:serine/threonine protein kinase
MANRYTTIKILGEGSFGTTRLAQDAYGRKVTIKTYKASGDLDAFNEEVSALEAVKSFCMIGLPCFVEAFRDGDKLNIVFQYVPGISLDSSKLEKPVSDDFTWSFLRQLLVILQNLHQRDIVHRDIKPGNVVFDPETKKFTLIDLGLSCLTQCNVFGGSEKFISDYILQSQKLPNPQVTLEDYKRSDVYALGLTAYYLMTGLDDFDISFWKNGDTLERFVYYLVKQMPSVDEALRKIPATNYDIEINKVYVEPESSVNPLPI